MKRLLPTRGETLPRWQPCLCMVLIGLLLYNPFAGLWGLNDGVCCDRMARNRATVGACELQHFPPVTNGAVQAEPDVDVRSTDLMPMIREERWVADPQEVLLPHAEFFPQFWKRPPPAL